MSLTKTHKILYYIFNFTWGLPMVIIGCIVSAALIVAGYKPTKSGGGWKFEVGDYWGGVSLGLCSIVDKESQWHTRAHEYGHSLQNAIWGFFFPFIIGIPSAIRYWIFEYRLKHNKPNPDYNAIWFERQATEWGIKTFNSWKN